jgi:hypothetical protein
MGERAKSQVGGAGGAGEADSLCHPPTWAPQCPTHPAPHLGGVCSPVLSSLRCSPIRCQMFFELQQLSRRARAAASLLLALCSARTFSSWGLQATDPETPCRGPRRRSAGNPETRGAMHPLGGAPGCPPACGLVGRRADGLKRPGCWSCVCAYAISALSKSAKQKSLAVLASQKLSLKTYCELQDALVLS